jgi:hypothetical protein
VGGLKATGKIVDVHFTGGDTPYFAYLAAQDTEGVDEFYVAKLAQDGAKLGSKLNHPISTTGDVLDIEVSSDGSYMLYRSKYDASSPEDLQFIDFEKPLTTGVGIHSGSSGVFDYKVQP